MKTIWSRTLDSAVSFILPTSAFSDASRPRTLLIRIKCPSSSTWRTGLIPSREPNTAEVLDTRPPRVQMHQVVYREPMAEMQLIFLQPLGIVVEAHPRLPVFIRIIHQQALAHGRGQRIHHHDLPFGIFGPEFLRPPGTGFIGAGQPARKRDVQYIFAGGQEGLGKIDEFVGIDLAPSRPVCPHEAGHKTPWTSF